MRSPSSPPFITPAGLRVSEPFRTAPVKPRTIRRGFEIHGYTGSNGGGKSLCAVYDSLPTLAAGRPIVSTVRILDPATGLPHPLYIPLDDFRTLLEVEFCDVILDEVTGVASSRDSAGMPSSVLNHLMQLRRRDVSLRWTTPNWKRADTGIREVTKGLTTCTGLVPEPAPKTDDGMDRIWRSRRLFSWKTFDAKNFDEWTTSKEKSPSKQYRLKPVARQMIWRPGLIAGDAYDTFDQVLTLGTVSESGLCMDCGGKRAPRRCECDKHLAEAIKNGTVIEPHDPTQGQLAWRQFAALRADNLARPVHIEETDDTPGVIVDTEAA